jgi:hypothetical protein
VEQAGQAGQAGQYFSKYFIKNFKKYFFKKKTKNSKKTCPDCPDCPDQERSFTKRFKNITPSIFVKKCAITLKKKQIHFILYYRLKILISSH